MPRRRSNSAPPGPRSSQVTIKTAAIEDPSLRRTRTVTAQEVRGFTQAEPTQRPTVYFRNAFTGAAAGRATQQHDVSENIGGHFQESPETFFGNLDRTNLHQPSVPHPARMAFLDQADHTANAVADDVFRVAMAGQTDPDPNEMDQLHTQAKTAARDQYLSTPKLVETTATHTHVSRSAFHDLTGDNLGQEQLLQDLRQGPLNTGTDNLARVRRDDGSYSESKDDWHVKRGRRDFSDL